MLNEIVLLTGEVEGPHLAAVLTSHNPELSVICAETASELKVACLAGEAGAPDSGINRRLIAYCTNVIVPASVLDAVTHPAYNFHPGPPTYPGAHASSFAIYEGARRFGVTAHVMERSVDSGAIVGVDWFDVPENERFLDLELKAYGQMLHLFNRLAHWLATSEVPLTELDMSWGARKTTTADYEKMKQFDGDMSEEEIKLRWRAFG